MKLTARLAYSQVKINRLRTLWTLVGIALSTALITAVCSFLASGDALIMHMLGPDYGEHGGTVFVVLLIPAAILGAIIISMSVVVISNAFRVSAGERAAQFGMLKSVGATKRQIMSTVMYESLFLSAVGIPAGIMLGLGLAFVGILVANNFLGEINSLVHIMITELVIELKFVVAWQAIIASVALSFGTVLLSAWRPARHSSRLAAIDSIRGTGSVRVEQKRVRTSRLTERTFGIEGSLAAKNMKRSRRSYRASLLSLTVGVVLFINLASLSAQVGAIESLLYPDVAAQVVVDYTSARSYRVNEVTGRDEVTIAVPIDDRCAGEVTARLREYPGVAVFGVGCDMETYDAAIPQEGLAAQASGGVLYDEEQAEHELAAMIVTLDADNYSRLCELAGVPLGSNLLLNRHDYNDNGYARVIEPFELAGQELRLVRADGSAWDVPIHAALTAEAVPRELMGMNTIPVKVIVPQGVTRDYTWYVETEDILGFSAYANAVMQELFPRDEGAAYMELGFTTRVYEIADYMKIMNIAIVFAEVFVYSFVALLTLIGLTNVISTISANVRMRSREFAVLQSVGMTRPGLQRMLGLESLMCSAKALVFGLPIALALTYALNVPIRAEYPVPYSIPWSAVMWCIVGVFAITGVTMRYAAARLRKQSIIEAIRAESGR